MADLSTSLKSAEHADSEGDMFRKLGVNLPSHLSTSRRRWAALVVVAISGAFASGPIASWPTLEPLLISAGVWAGPDQQSNLTNVFSLASGLSMVTQLCAGIWYDVRGPRDVGAYGAFLAGVCLFVMALAIIVPSLNFLLWFAYPAAVVFGGVNTMDVFAWLWLLPEDQNTVSAVAMAVEQLSDSFVLIAVFLNSSCGIPIQYYFVIAGGLSIVAGYLALFLIPTQPELMHISRVVNGQSRADFSDRNYGATDDAESKACESEHENSTGFWSILHKTWTNLRDLRILVFKVHPTVFLLFLLYTTSAYQYTIFPTIDMFPFYEDMVGTKKAVRLVNIFGGLNAGCSAVSALIYGKLVDTFGIVNAVAAAIVPFLATMYLYTIPSISAQTFAQVLLSFYSSTYYVIWPRFACLYGPPELFGIIWGLAVAIMGMFQLFLPHSITWGWKFFAHLLESGRAIQAVPYLIVFAFWCLLTVFFSILLLLWWWFYPPPEVGSTTIAQLHSMEEESSELVDQAATTFSADEIVARPSPAAPPSLAPRSEARYTTSGCGSGCFRCSCHGIP